MEVIRKMFEVFENILGQLSEIVYNVYWNQKYLEENSDFISRCADRSDIVYEAQFSDAVIFCMEKFNVKGDTFKGAFKPIKRPYITEIDLSSLEAIYYEHL